MTRVTWVAAALAVVVAVVGCSGPDPSAPSASGSPTAATESAAASADEAGPTPVTAENLDEAFTAAGLDCDLIRASTSCYFDEIPMPVIVPFDWDVDVEERTEACEQGYIDAEYEVVGDGATWYAAPNEPVYGQEMIDALEKAGYQATWQPYCP